MFIVTNRISVLQQRKINYSLTTILIVYKERQ